MSCHLLISRVPLTQQHGSAVRLGHRPREIVKNTLAFRQHALRLEEASCMAKIAAVQEMLSKVPMRDRASDLDEDGLLNLK